MIHQGELSPFFARGKITPYAPAFQFIYGVPSIAGAKEDLRIEAIRKEFDQPFAEQVINALPYGDVFDEPVEWSAEVEPKQVDSGFFVFAEDIDWEKGSLEADLSHEMIKLEYMFSDDNEFFSTEFEKASYLASLQGLCFDRDVIEMLLPQSDGIIINQSVRIHSARQRGRPPKWDWEGAMAHIVSLAQHPDGLPTGTGAQAAIERIITDWFFAESGNSPAPSQVRVRAGSIMSKIELPKNH